MQVDSAGTRLALQTNRPCVDSKARSVPMVRLERLSHMTVASVVPVVAVAL